MRFLWTIIVCCFLLAFKNDPHTFSIRVETVFGNELLQLNTKKYVNENNDTLTVESFRFYLSNFTVYSKGKKQVVKNSYFLIDAEKEEGKKIVLTNLSFTSVDSLDFYIGVDSVACVSGALDGALDPTLGMFWAWNTGYIHAKLEGKSNSCKTLHHAYEFHIGGYLQPYNPLRKITIRTNGTNAIQLKADAAKWFSGRQKINLKEFNSVMFPCKNALVVADNYAEMFSVVK